MAVYIGQDFVIRPRALKSQSGDKAVCAWPFADLRVNQEGLICELYDLTSPHQAMLDAIKEDERFLETCNFEVHNLYKSEIIVTFDGTIYDALTYLMDTMRTVQDAGQKDAR